LSNPDNPSLHALFSEPRLTTEQVVRFLNESGFPISVPYFRKISAPAVNAGPPFTWWGGVKLYSPSLTLKWAQERNGGTKRGTLAIVA
jgi:hypothetical protein